MDIVQQSLGVENPILVPQCFLVPPLPPPCLEILVELFMQLPQHASWFDRAAIPSGPGEPVEHEEPLHLFRVSQPVSCPVRRHRR